MRLRYICRDVEPQCVVKRCSWSVYRGGGCLLCVSPQWSYCFLGKPRHVCIPIITTEGSVYTVFDSKGPFIMDHRGEVMGIDVYFTPQQKKK